MSFIVTETWLRRHATNGIGWTYRQLKAIGVQVPMKRGWMEKVIGTTISDEAKHFFETAPKSKAVRNKMRRLEEALGEDDKLSDPRYE